MKREDWLWLVLKGVGLWFVVQAIEALALESWMVFRPGRFDYGGGDGDVLTGREQFFRVGLLAAAGLFCLLFDFGRWLSDGRASPPAGPGSESSSESAGVSSTRASLGREDWLWVGLKLVGCYWAIYLLLLMSASIPWQANGLAELAVSLLPMTAAFVASLWLLLGERIWRAAVGRRRASAAGPGRGTWRRDALWVALVFGLLAGVPLALLWWAQGALQ